MRTLITALTVMMMLSSCIGDEDINGNSDGKGSGWVKEWGSDRIDVLNAIAVGPDDTVYVGGETWGNLYSEKEGDRDANLAAFNPKGNELWGKQWSVNDGRNDVQALVVDDEGNIYVGGGKVLL
jgi:outer membrane protein assembly factor BamB